MDITIQNVRSPALEHNGRYYKVFQPRTRDELLKLHHMGCVGDTVLTDIQIEQGDFPTGFVEPTITQRSLSGLFKDMRNIELELKDPNSGLWGKIQQNNQGALTQFFDKNVKSAIAQTASEIMQEVRDAANSARVQVTSEGVTIGSTKISGKQLASTIVTSPEAIDLISPKIRVQSDMIVDGAITTGKIAAGSVTAIALDAEAVTAEKLKVDQSFFNKLVANEAYLNQLFAKQAFINRVQSVAIDASQVRSGILSGDRIYGGTIRGTEINGTTITGNSRITIGENGFLRPTQEGGLQINVPETFNASKGIGVQLFGRNFGKIPKGMFIYNSPNWGGGNLIGESVADTLLTVKGLTSLCNLYRGQPMSGLPINSNFSYGNPVENLYRISFIAWDPRHGQMFVNDGTDTDGTWWFKPDASSSDKRLKTNIQDTDFEATDFVKKLEFKQFDWKPDKFGYKKPYTNVGLIAQDVERLDSSLVYSQGENLALDDFRLGNIALKAIQELSQRIETLERKLA